MYAIGKNLETCAYKKCAQPAEAELGHVANGPSVLTATVVLLGYCQYHADKIIERRKLGLAA